jgi:hypothetical protein
MDRKSFDSFLARLGADVLPPGRQGVERRVPVGSLELLALTREISEELRVPAREAIALAKAALGGEVALATDLHESVATIGRFSSLQVDRAALKREIQERLESAIESVVRPRRGRPPRRG